MQPHCRSLPRVSRVLEMLLLGQASSCWPLFAELS